MSNFEFPLPTPRQRGRILLGALLSLMILPTVASAQIAGETFDFALSAGIDGIAGDGLAFTGELVDIVPETEVAFGADPSVPVSVFDNSLAAEGTSTSLFAAFVPIEGSENSFTLTVSTFQAGEFLASLIEAGQEFEPGVPFEGILVSFGSADNPIDPLFGTTGFDDFVVDSSTLSVFANFGGGVAFPLPPTIVDGGLFFDIPFILDTFDIATADLGTVFAVTTASGPVSGFQIDTVITLVPAVPEPSAGLLSLLSLAGVVARRGRR